MPLHTALVYKCEISCDVTVVAMEGHSPRFSVRHKVAPNLPLFYWVTVAHRMRVWEGGRLNCHSASGGIITEEFCAVQLSWYEQGTPIRGKSGRSVKWITSLYNASIKMCELYIFFPICIRGSLPKTWLTLSSCYIVSEVDVNRYFKSVTRAEKKRNARTMLVGKSLRKRSCIRLEPRFLRTQEAEILGSNDGLL